MADTRSRRLLHGSRASECKGSKFTTFLSRDQIVAEKQSYKESTTSYHPQPATFTDADMERGVVGVDAEKRPESDPGSRRL